MLIEIMGVITAIVLGVFLIKVLHRSYKIRKVKKILQEIFNND